MLANMVAPYYLITASLVGIACAGLVPRANVPSANGFPQPDKHESLTIAQQAGGLLPNAPPPKTLGNGSIAALQLIAFNELFETALFNSLINNITSNATGYNDTPDGALEALEAVRAQEEQHALAAIGTLKNTGAFAPVPCRYQFPTAQNFTSAIALAETVTAVVLGVLQEANVFFSQDRAPDLVRLTSSIIGQEGEQTGYYRRLLGLVPSESPFLTYVPASYAFSALQLFVVNGSCNYTLSKVGNLTIFPPIATNGGPVALIPPKNQTLSFQTNLTDSKAAQQYVGKNTSSLYFTYTTGQQLPFSVPLQNASWSGSVLSFRADFPYEKHVMHGFSHGALTVGGNFTNATTQANATLAAPAVIQVNNSIPTNSTMGM
ncbi:late sexual development protein [Emericellopsis atlantica]|uniref:Late sexual development protein n=1 Tax=Emericellopsis atlantica TaxID=2614577 RepID=A0A9P8CSH6_9HYPO|nr:late sexual development protein [Emericellopsis atlantica]KAG9257367.1 late sexual development protein [Emericellopsis atlantica]